MHASVPLQLRPRDSETDTHLRTRNVHPRLHMYTNVLQIGFDTHTDRGDFDGGYFLRHFSVPHDFVCQFSPGHARSHRGCGMRCEAKVAIRPGRIFGKCKISNKEMHTTFVEKNNVGYR